MRRIPTIDEGVRAILSSPAFAVVFGAFLVAALALGIAYPLGPGQDFHYHFFNAAVTRRLWTGDADFRALYHTLNPLDSNTLLYTFLFPFELALKPLTAWRLGFSLYYFVGYPVACAVALRLLRRPVWGAVLAFPLAYVKMWSHGGYMPFVSAAPWLVLSVGLLHRVNEGKASRRLLLAAVVAPSLAFIAHAHVYCWMMVVLASVTVVSIVRELVPGLLRTPGASLKRALFLGLRALLVVLPSLLLFGLWYGRTHYGDHATASTSYVPNFLTPQVKLSNAWGLLVHVQGQREFEFFIAFIVVVFLALALGRRRRDASTPTAEIAVVLTFLSWWFLPSDISGQMIADRHMDMAVWLLPLAVYAGEPLGGRFRHGLAVTAIVVFSVVRLGHLGVALRTLQREYAGILALAKTCPPAFGEVGYVSVTDVNADWYGKGLHQAHETFAALCGLDTPVYDAREYPHNLLPLRYKGAPPSPITIVMSLGGWWRNEALRTQFDYVLVNAGRSRPASREAEASFELLREAEGWQLWRPRAGRSSVRRD